jgi:hypothetical protein
MLKTAAMIARFRFDSQIRTAMDSMTGAQSQRCPRCGVRPLLSWNELTEEEREVVRRLPASADYSLDERQAMHRWCRNCWHEEIESEAVDA